MVVVKVGAVVQETYCETVFQDCRVQQCNVQSPGFPGVYPQGISCRWDWSMDCCHCGYRISFLLFLSERSYFHNHWITLKLFILISDITFQQEAPWSDSMLTDLTGRLSMLMVEDVTVLWGALSENSPLMESVLMTMWDCMMVLMNTLLSLVSSVALEAFLSQSLVLQTNYFLSLWLQNMAL